MKNSNFSDKKEYLQYRKDWKDEYKQLSETIRDHKWMHKQYSHACAHAFVERNTKDNLYYIKYYNRIDELLKQNPRYIHLQEKYKKDRKWLEYYQKQATEMLAEMKLSKQKAQQQCLAAKQQKVEILET